VKLVDTPGIYDGTTSASSIITDLMSETKCKICLLLIVVSLLDRIGSQTILMLNNMRKLIESDRIIIVFTYCDKIEDYKGYSDIMLEAINEKLDEGCKISNKLCFK
jgi:GTPase Era involved in 16S rRNA processing